jgi:hypothetical protein
MATPIPIEAGSFSKINEEKKWKSTDPAHSWQHAEMYSPQEIEMSGPWMSQADRETLPHP